MNKKDGNYVMADLNGYTKKSKVCKPIRYNKHFTRYGVSYTLYPIEGFHNSVDIHWARMWLRKNISNGITAKLDWKSEDTDEKEKLLTIYPYNNDTPIA